MYQPYNSLWQSIILQTFYQPGPIHKVREAATSLKRDVIEMPLPPSQNVFNGEKINLKSSAHPLSPPMQVTGESHCTKSGIPVFVRTNILGAMKRIHDWHSFWKQSQNSRGVFILYDPHLKTNLVFLHITCSFSSLCPIYPIMWIRLVST